MTVGCPRCLRAELSAGLVSILSTGCGALNGSSCSAPHPTLAADEASPPMWLYAPPWVAPRLRAWGSTLGTPRSSTAGSPTMPDLVPVMRSDVFIEGAAAVRILE